MPEQLLGNSPFSVRSRRSSSSVSSDTLRKSSDGGGAGMTEGGRVRRKRRSRIPVRQATGLYVHSSPPTVVPVHPSIVRQWLRGGEINRLQEIVLKKKIDELHAAARIGEIDNVDAILKSEPRVNLELSRDNSGTGLLHKAVIHGHVPLQEWLLKNYPKTVEVLDKEKRNPLHYAGGNEEVWNRLVAGGADTSTVDREGYSPAFYMNHPRRLRPPAPESRKVVSQANQGIVVKPSNIRIWIHDKDLGRLQKVMWEGMGDKLKTETSSQPLVRRFLNAVPYIMGSIRDVHNAAVNNDIELLKSKSSDPVPKDILLSKDANGLNALHKAAGLGNMEVARAIIDRAPEAVNSKDHLDRTPLHYAAALKDQNQMYQLLVDSNATDHLEDKKGNTPSHYRARPSDLDGPKLLNVIPDAPRTAHIFPPSWDWRLLTGDATTDSPMASPQVEAPPQIGSPPQVEGPPQVEAPPPVGAPPQFEATPQIPDAKEPEEPEQKVEERQVDDKPPEIEPSPEEESEVEQDESKDATEPPGISDDEGVGSEANPSVENTSTPLSDTVNEEEEISGARLGETMTLTTSLFSSKGPRIEESVNGTDSGNEDGDQSENRMINVENGEVEYLQVDPSDPLLSNLQGSAEGNLGGALDDKIEGVVSEEQDQQNDSKNPGDGQEDIIQDVNDEQLLESTSDTPQFDEDEPKPNLDGQPPPEADPVTTIQSSEQEGNIVLRDESVSREEETEMLENIKNDSGEQTDNQNNLTNSDSINIQAEEGAKSEEEPNIEFGDETQDSNQTLGSTLDLNSTYTKIPSNDATEAEMEGENDTAVNMTDERPSTQNQYTESPVDVSPLSLQDQLVGEESKDHPENDPKVVEESSQSEGMEDIPAQNLDQTNDEGVSLENVSASNSRPSSRKSEVATPRSRLSTPASKLNQEEIDSKNLENNEIPSSGRQLEGNGDHEIEDDVGIGISNELEDGNDSGSADRSGLDPVEIVDDGSMLEPQVDLQENVELIEDNLDSTIVLTKEEGDVQGDEEPIGDGEAEDVDSTELLDRPITTRSAGGSRAEILAITPAPPDEEDVLEADDQKAVQDTGEEDRTAAEELVAAGDMERMAEMVLNGRGSALLNMSSTNSDVQLFINNIPQYIAKIERVHVAAREGDLRGVQTALDRRKFAVARDNSTPLKPTPLHVAALFGRTSVLRYLAGRFPETMHAQDAGGRTALHYAATLPDNGHFYSLLVTLGADKSVIDNEGRTAEYYLRNKGELSREELLNEYQNRPVPVDTTGLNFNRFSDKVENDQVSSRKDVDDQVLLTKLDACLRLIRMRAPGSLLSRMLQDDVYQEMKLRSTRLDNSLLDLITPGVRDIALGKARLLRDKLFTGLSVPDYESYKVFEEILLPTVREVNGIRENDDTPIQPPSDYYGSESKDYFLKMNLDPSGMILKSFTVEISRNLQVAALPQNLKLSELEKTEVAVTAYLTLFYKKNKDNTFIDESGENFGAYYSLSEVVDNKEVFSDLKQEELIAEGMDEPVAENWPYGRGVFISPFGDITAWINIRDHLKLFSITSTEKSGAVGEAYYSAFEIITLIEEKLEVKRDTKLGYLTSDPALVGNALRFKALLNLPHLSQDRIGLRKLCKERRLLLKQSHKTSQFNVFSTTCLGITEIESFKKYVESLSLLIEAERNQMKGTILQIPNLIKTFLHKKPK